MQKRKREDRHCGMACRAGDQTLRTLPGSVEYAPPLALMTRHKFLGPHRRAGRAFAATIAAERSALIAWRVPTEVEAKT
jgi:hypothetical protein